MTFPGGGDRGGHAHKELYQVIVAASGSFNVLLDDGMNKKIVTLNRPDYGVMVVPGIWRELFEFPPVPSAWCWLHISITKMIISEIMINSLTLSKALM